MQRRQFLGTTAVALAAARPDRALAQSAPLRVAATASDSYAEALYGVDEGMFTKAGLNVDLQILGSGAAITTAVAAGAADIGITNPLPLLAAVEHGIPFVYICAGALINFDEGSLCVSPDSPIHTGKDFDGKTIATSSLADINVVAIKAWIDRAGGDSSKARFVEIPFAQMGPSLQRGVVDAAPIVEPALSVAKQAGSVRVLLPPMYSVFGPNFMIASWFCRSDWLQSNRDTARRFVGAIYDVARWANAHGDESAAILAKYAKLDPQVLKTMSRAPYATSLTPAMLQNVLDLAYQYKAVAKRVAPADVIARV
jgi:NitT/TauT family transport system substrate-binding protein